MRFAEAINTLAKGQFVPFNHQNCTHFGLRNIKGYCRTL